MCVGIVRYVMCLGIVRYVEERRVWDAQRLPVKGLGLEPGIFERGGLGSRAPFFSEATTGTGGSLRVVTFYGRCSKNFALFLEAEFAAQGSGINFLAREGRAKARRKVGERS